MPQTTELSRILRNAAANVNSQLSVPLKKIAEFGDEHRGAGVYRDTEWNEYRVLTVGDGEWLSASDYHTSDKQDALDTAALITKPNPPGWDKIEAGAETEPRPALPTRPRGYYAQPSSLMNRLLARV